MLASPAAPHTRRPPPFHTGRQVCGLFPCVQVEKRSKPVRWKTAPRRKKPGLLKRFESWFAPWLSPTNWRPAK